MPICSSATSPARIHYWAVCAPPITMTFLSPAAAFACASATMLCVAFSIPECDGKNFFSLALFERLFALAFKARTIPSLEVGW